MENLFRFPETAALEWIALLSLSGDPKSERCLFVGGDADEPIQSFHFKLVLFGIA